MQLKPITTIAVLLLVVASLLVSGCTQTTKQTDTANSILADIQSSSTASPSTDKVKSLTDNISKDFIVVTPFQKSTNANGNVVYTATVKDKPDKLYQFQRNITYELIGDAQTARALFNKTVQAFEAKGYVEYMPSDARWTGFYGSTAGLTQVTAKQQVMIAIAQPGNYAPANGPDVYIYPFGFNSFAVVTSEDTKLV